MPILRITSMSNPDERTTSMSNPDKVISRWQKIVLAETMLESYWLLLQDSRLNYVEQHAERIGLDSDKLENLRVNASKASPMGDTLDLCARYADAKTLDEMVMRTTSEMLLNN